MVVCRETLVGSGAPCQHRPMDAQHWVPGLETLRTYRRGWLGRDLVAGLVITALLIPQGMAYAELAGLPAVTGLYTTVVALIAYAVLGPSRILVLGPDSALGPLIAAAILPLVGAGGDPARAVWLASALALIMGAMCVVAGLARLGTVAELLSKPVRIGYLNGLAIVVVVSQLPKLFGFSTDATGLAAELRAWITGIHDGRTVPAALLVGLGSLAVILACRTWLPRVPGVLVAVVGSIVAVSVFHLTEHGVSVVGAVPRGFPAPSLPRVSWHDITTLVLAAAGLAFVTIADTTALSRTLALRRGDDVDPNQEIVALGAANIAAGFFKGFPVSASASRTAVAETSDARTQLTGVVAAVAVIAVLVFASGIMRNLPSSTLAAIVIAAALTLFDLSTMRWLAKVRRSELLLSLAALTGVAVLGVLAGIVVAIALSLGNFIRRAWRPHDAVLARVRGRKGYHDLSRHPEAEQIPGLVLYRFDAPLFFANADWFIRRIKEVIEDRDEQIRWVIVAAEPITDIDTTGADAITTLVRELRDNGIELAFAELKGPVADRLRSYEIYDHIGPSRFFPTVGRAINGYLEETGVVWEDWSHRRPTAD